MTISLLALTFLTALVAALGLVDTLAAIGAILAILAVALGIAVFVMPTLNVTRFSRLMQPVLITVLATPALWMLMQVLPMPVQALSNQIWATAAMALHQPLTGAITIDRGATVVSLAHYCMVVAAFMIATAHALDTQRATDLLYLLIAFTAVAAIALFGIELGLLDPGQAGSQELAFIAILGTVVSGAGIICLYDKLPRAGRPRRGVASSNWLLGVICGAFALSFGTILIREEARHVFGILSGVGTLGAIFAIRRWSLGAWGKAGLAVLALALVLGAAAVFPVELDIAGQRHNQAAADRMIADVPLTGSGAGAYEALLSIYREIDAGTDLPTTAAKISIEMGRFFFIGVTIAIVSFAWMLFSRALKRRQNYAFSSAGAAMLIGIALLLFFNSGLLGVAASLLVGILAGVALGQSLSASDVVGVSSHVVLEDGIQLGQTPSSLRPRAVLGLLSIVLVVQAVWILGAERCRFGGYLLILQNAATCARPEELRKIASFAVIRGDLWAASARAQIARRGAEAVTGGESASALALADLESALRHAPHRSDAWLMLALLVERDNLAGFDVGSLLKMSYYTAPNDTALLFERLKAALRVEAKAPDAEIEDMIRHDVTLAVKRQPQLRPLLAAAYRSASPPQKSVAERFILEVDPEYMRSIRSP